VGFLCSVCAPSCTIGTCIVNAAATQKTTTLHTHTLNPPLTPTPTHINKQRKRPSRATYYQPPTTAMHIVVRQEADGRAFEFDMPPTTTVGQLQQRLNDEHGAPADRQRLYCDDTRLRTDDLIALAPSFPESASADADEQQGSTSVLSSLWSSIRGQGDSTSAAASADLEPQAIPELVELSLVYDLNGGACCEW
jgi:Ubiquitin family